MHFTKQTYCQCYCNWPPCTDFTKQSYTRPTASITAINALCKLSRALSPTVRLTTTPILAEQRHSLLPPLSTMHTLHKAEPSQSLCQCYHHWPSWTHLQSKQCPAFTIMQTLHIWVPLPALPLTIMQTLHIWVLLPELPPLTIHYACTLQNHISPTASALLCKKFMQ